MTTIQQKSPQEDAVSNTSSISTSNVQSLRKIFENNFKLSSFTNAFKDKSKSKKIIVHQQNVNKESAVAKELKIHKSVTPVSIPHENYLNCKLPNCCCKTFFREYNNTPGHRYCHQLKTPLRDCSSDLNRMIQSCSTSTAISDRIRPVIGKENILPDRNSRNVVHQINYEFYKPKSDVITKLPQPKMKTNIEETKAGSQSGSKFLFNKLDGTERRKQVKGKVFEFKAENKDSSNRSYGFVNFTTTSMNEAGYLKCEDVKNNVKGEVDIKDGNCSFKYRVSKTSSSIREIAHPYVARKSRLTVKGVKNRNLRNMKQRQKLQQQQCLSRSYTFNGYDNFAFRPSLTHLQLSQNEDESPARDIISPKEVIESSKFRPESRMNVYDLPVTSFYIGKADAGKADQSVDDIKHKNPIDPKESTISKSDESNLKRHCSLGYLDDEQDYDYRFSRNRRSLGNISNISSKMYALRSVPDISKDVKFKKSHSFDIDAQVLFSAVEHGQLDKAKKILESSNLNINSLNSDNLSPLDVAVLSNNKPLARLLISHGAETGLAYPDSNSMRDHLLHLLQVAESRVHDLNNSWCSGIDLDQSRSNSKSKTLSLWERRFKGLTRMLSGFDQIEIPEPPSVVTIEVTSDTSIKISYSLTESNSSMITKLAVQWSTDADFSSLNGYHEISDMRKSHYNITNLLKGQRYYVRVAAGNVKGLSVFKSSSPSSIIPSSWRDTSKLVTRFNDEMRNTLHNILQQLTQTHPHLKTYSDLCTYSSQASNQNRKKKTTLRQLFTASSKFQKNLRRGVYLSCLFYHENKILVTNDDFLPVIEVDESYSKKLSTDFNWFLKVSCNWKDLKWLKNDLEKSEASSVDVRIKLLHAAIQMQTALNTSDLGKLYYKVLRDDEGTSVICLINCISSSKSVSFLNLRWVPPVKLTKRSKLIHITQSNISDLLMSSVPDQIAFHESCNTKLPRGLYLSYVKIRSSVDSLQLIVPSKSPNILPHYKIRDNPHVTAEEWQWLVNDFVSKSNSSPFSRQHHKEFMMQIGLTAQKLCRSMEIPEVDINFQRLYNVEVIEVTKNISLILLIPPSDTICAIPDQKEMLLQCSDLLSLPIQVFEMAHFTSYQADLVNLHSRLSYIIEMDIDITQHELRQAFYSSEVCIAKKKLSQLEDLQIQLNTAWRKAHWLLDVVTFARDRSSAPPTIDNLLNNSRRGRSISSRSSKRSLKVKGDANLLDTTQEEISRTQMLSISCLAEKSSQSSKSYSSKKFGSSNSPMRSDFSCDINANFSSTSSSSGRSLKVSNKFHSTDKTITLNDKLASTRNTDIQNSQASTAILQIRAAYTISSETQRLFKFHVSHRTTVREIVDMFIRQTNMSTRLKGKDGPIYSEKDTLNFCLVIVNNNRERCLPDNFTLLSLEQSWMSGRLYVRRRSKVWAALKLDSKLPKQPTYV